MLMKKISVWFGEAKARWKAQTPRVFRKVQWVCAFVSTVALGINSACMMAGAVMPDWWIAAYPYLIGASAALLAGYQFTRCYGNDGKPIMPDVAPKRKRRGRKKEDSGNTVLEMDDF